ncbi:MAG: type II toxin-antitoxin system RatA family toxin [Alphaproteobacteria bacterium]|nr:type II toxin-antitoxin system RatA family toxin [Alphaproteobacteria bacterium]NCQ67254.1 type II toxin-antitoxin system RatA family toxin [Alphaproteobacteria bacterium]NCT07097.1 type II toxin-antitoxin system RatA family toxin [Alphaproteobacteria bacterium]
MPRFQDKHSLPFTPKQLYDIVLDIEKYPDFLPWCTRSEIIERLDEEGKLYASVSAGYALYSETYLSKVFFQDAKRIEATYIEGPFKNLHTLWLFNEHPKGCELLFSVDFEFETGLLNTVAKHMFTQVTEKMVEAFIQRAHALYAPPSHVI